MKKLIIGLLLPSLIFSGGCKKFVDGYDESPNNPRKATAPLLLSGVELGMMAVYTGQLGRNTATLTQQCGGVSEQMLEVDNYALREGDNTNDWTSVFYNMVMPCNDIILNYGSTATHHKGVAKILKAMALGIATDTWGDVPATEAGMIQFGGPEKPKYDKQEDVIKMIQTLLDEGIADLKTNNASDLIRLGKEDIIFWEEGIKPEDQAAKWINAAWMLKVRYANRLSKIDPAGSAAKVLEFIANVKNTGDMVSKHGSGGFELNQWYAFKNARPNYLAMGDKLVGLLKDDARLKEFKDTIDPRLRVYADTTEDGEYIGATPGSANTAASAIGPYAATASGSLPMVTYYEMQFINAEALLRQNRKAEAAIAFNEAVKLNVRRATGLDTFKLFYDAVASETDATISLEKVMTQKYIAMFTQIEAWADWRRTGFPTLTANPNSVLPTKGAIPRRYVTVQDERQYNNNAPLVSDVLARVWWDKQ